MYYWTWKTKHVGDSQYNKKEISCRKVALPCSLQLSSPEFISNETFITIPNCSTFFRQTLFKALIRYKIYYNRKIRVFYEWFHCQRRFVQAPQSKKENVWSECENTRADMEHTYYARHTVDIKECLLY